MRKAIYLNIRKKKQNYSYELLQLFVKTGCFNSKVANRNSSNEKSSQIRKKRISAAGKDMKDGKKEF